MIIDALINMFYGLIINLTSPLSNISLAWINLDYFNPLFQGLGVIFYVMPSFAFFTPILVFLAGLYGIRLAISIYHLIPLCG